VLEVPGIIKFLQAS